jgi:AcrR family transcriptional regulator
MQEVFRMKRIGPGPGSPPEDETEEESQDGSQDGSEDGSARTRILNAAFDVLREHGYSATQTREIAARARVSKRDIYSEFGSKEGIFAALITARAELMHGPARQADVSSRQALQATLQAVGVAFLTQLYDPAVVSMFRLAIASAEAAPEMARILDRNGFQPNRRAMGEMMAGAVKAGIISGEPASLAGQFFALLTGRDHVSVLLGTAQQPTPRERAQRVGQAVADFLELHGGSKTGPPVRPK